MDFLAKARKLSPAPAPNDDPTKIKGNISLDKKQLAANIFAWHIANYPGSNVFGHSELKNLRLSEVYVRRVGMGKQTELVGEDEPAEALRSIALEGQTVCEVTVEKNMLNVHGALAGGCSAHMLDIGTFSPLLILSLVTGIDATGMSTAMNIVWHSAASLGMELVMVSTTLTLGGRVTAARAEMYDKKTARLLVSGVHTIAPFQAPSRKRKADTSGEKSRL
ncbi:hypothetical protein WOLCODRAFT_162511 [Wolfiporia cocos MD-104 SS10]|uniref:Thioesterase domain-containing protein n=1 Tax=Wolfiporia cocos (strain MD-104) TaxID=742152 RepID=A0A2H3JFS2_WOLCO|nr:hypothetical protein WOLCODRAFT_162511 [Wolfiporia cocos MD-104 SS10]